MSGIIKITLKVDKFADKMIRDAGRVRHKALFGMAIAARNELRNVVRKKKGISAPGAPPNDHGTYRKSALFSVDLVQGDIEAGFSGIKPKGSKFRNSFTRPYGNGFAQDKLEFGGKIKYKLIYRDKSKNPLTRTIIVKPRPHVSVAEDNLFTKNTKNTRNFQKSQAILIDQGYLK